MPDAVSFRARVLGVTATLLALPLAGCDLAGLTEPGGLLDVSLPGQVPEQGEEVVFEGQVVVVDVEAGTFSLADGTGVRVGEGVSPGEEYGVTSLEGAADVLEGELELIAWGQGSVETTEPLVVEATDLMFKPAERIEFEGRVASVDLAAGTLTFESGTVVKVTRATELSDDFEVPSLDAVREALEAGEDLVAWGSGWERTAEPRVVLARVITFEIVEPPSVEFEGHLASVDVEGGTFELVNGTVVRTSAETSFGDDYGIPSLDAAKQALDAGKIVAGWGHGVLEGEEPRTVAAAAVTFREVE